MEFRVLGPLEVISEGERLPLGRGKQRALLAVLLLHANEVVSSDRLIDLLWGDEAPDTAAKALQVHVSQLRKALEPRENGESARAVKTRAPGYVLEIDPEQLDLHRFERLAAEGRRALEAGNPSEAAERLGAALALWRGPALADFAYADFAQAEASRIEEMRLAAFEDEIQAKVECGRHGEAIGELERLIAAEPLRERPRAQLMLALYRSGRQADALEAYAAARQALVDQLGIEPGRELKELQAAILNQDPSLELAQVAREEPEEAEEARGTFVGREAELAELAAGLDAAVAGRGSLFLIVGEPGIGKSRLAEEMSRRARAAGARVLVGRCWEAGGAPAYWPWVQSLRSYVERVEPDTLRQQLGAGASDVAQIVPTLRELFPDLPETAAETEGARFRLFDSVTRFLRNAASARPLVIILDDLHAADEPSLLLLRFLAGELADSRILVVGSYRDVDPTVRDPLASTLAELAREPVTRRVELRGLRDVDVARYIELATGETPPKRLVAAIHAETEGNPLFVGEVARLLAAEGRLTNLDPETLWTLGLPQGVREVIGRRLSRLSPECERVLSLGSVLGREMTIDALGGLSELSRDELLEVLDEAVEARVLTAIPGSPGRYRYGHALIQQTLYDQLTTPRRVQFHRRAGQVLEALYAPDPEPHLSELAHHFFQAAAGGDGDKALDYASRAADRASRQLAYEEAARFYEQALQLLELKQPSDARSRCELLLGRGDALAKAGRMADAKEAFVAAAEIARASGFSEQLARAALGYGGRYPFARAGPDMRLVPLLEEALGALGEEESVMRVRLMARLAAALRDQPSLEPRSSLSSEAVAIARRLGDGAALVDALISQFTATWTPDAERLLPIAEEVGSLAKETGDSERAFQGSFLKYVASVTLGDPERVATLAEEHRALASVLKQPALQWLSLVLRSFWALSSGEFATGERLAQEALEVGQHAQSWDAGFSHRMALFILRREQGGLDQVDELIRRSVEEYPGYRLFRCLVPLLDCELGRPEEAAWELETLSADAFSALPPDSEYLFCLSILCEVAAQLNDAERADTLRRLLQPYANLTALASGEVSIGCVARYIGLAATTTEDWEEAERHFREALEVNTRMGARPWVAHTQHDHARTLLGRDAPGDRMRARELLTAALETYRELGMEPWVKRAGANLTELS